MKGSRMRCKRSVLVIAVTLAWLSSCASSPQAKEAKYLEKGKKEYQQKRYDNAVLHFKTAAQAQPSDAEPCYQLGLAYLGLNDFWNAGLCFRKASELNPKHARAQLKLAELMATSSDKAVIEEAQKRSQ